MTTAKTEELRFASAQDAIDELSKRLRAAHDAHEKLAASDEEVIDTLVRHLHTAYETIDRQKAELNMQIVRIGEVRYDAAGKITAVVSRTIKEDA